MQIDRRHLLRGMVGFGAALISSSALTGAARATPPGLAKKTPTLVTDTATPIPVLDTPTPTLGVATNTPTLTPTPTDTLVPTLTTTPTTTPTTSTYVYSTGSYGSAFYGAAA